MCAAGGGHLLPASPVSCHGSSTWRITRSAVSSPEFSDSKEEEEMDIDPDEHSPRTRVDSVLSPASSHRNGSLTRSPTSFPRNKSLTLFSLSDLCISEQYHKPPASSKNQELSKNAFSRRLPSFEKTSRSSLNFAHSAKQSLYTLTYESFESDCHLSSLPDVTQVSSPGLTSKEQLSLAPLNEMKNTSPAHSTLRSASLQQEKHKLSSKFFMFSVPFMVSAVAVFVGINRSPATHCVDNIDLKSLCHELEHRVHGQHIAVNVVVKRIEEFTTMSEQRLLVMSFHGWTGIGKNFMSSIIAQHLPPTNVHQFIVPLHFARGMETDALLLSDWIISNVSSPSCGLHLFIVDEIDKAHSSLVHSLRESLITLSVGTDITCRVIFLLLTNDGATEINTAVAEVLMNGGSREDIESTNLILSLSSEWYTELISAQLIDQVVPFLPLERQHVARCTEAELKLRRAHVTPQLVNDIVNSLSYFPSDISLFSSSGCRRITHLVDRFL